jgi:glycosyltransferase involved in cell wall biosynthesis
MIKKYSFILPVFNQEKKIHKNLVILDNKLQNIKNINYEIIAVDDGSSDDTWSKLKFIKNKLPKIKIFRNIQNFGKGYSIRQGIKKIKKKTNYIIIIDSDLPYFNKIEIIISKLIYHKLLIINRKHKKSRLVLKKLNFYTLARYIAGNIFNLIIRLLGFTTLRDTQAGLKGFSAKYKNFIAMTKTNSFLYDVELMIIFKKKNITPVSIPCRYIISKNSSIQFSKFSLLKKILFDFFVITYSFYFGKYSKL